MRERDGVSVDDQQFPRIVFVCLSHRICIRSDLFLHKIGVFRQQVPSEEQLLKICHVIEMGEAVERERSI